MDGMQKTKDHLMTHIKYPASTEEIMKACENWSDVPENLKKEALEKLPAKNWNSSEEVISALNWM